MVFFFVVVVADIGIKKSKGYGEGKRYLMGLSCNDNDDFIIFIPFFVLIFPRNVEIDRFFFYFFARLFSKSFLSKKKEVNIVDSLIRF